MIKTIIKSKYFIPLLIEIIHISILSPCIFNCLLAKEEYLYNIINENGIHYYTLILILMSIIWMFFVICLFKTTTKIDKLIKENKKNER